MNRRDSLACLGIVAPLLLSGNQSVDSMRTAIKRKQFSFCLNTSTISGCGEYSVVDYINIAGEAGYDGVELWMGDIRKYLEQGGTKLEITTALKKHKLTFENTIGFAPWLSGSQGLEKMHSDMKLLATLGAKRIAAPPVGYKGEEALDLLAMGEQYKKLLAIGRETGVMPQLEFWGASDIFWHLGQAMMVLTATGEKDARLLPDIYHLFRGGSDFEALHLLNNQYIEVFHMNDYPGDKDRLEQNDADRIFPGDGVGPLVEVLTYLSGSSGEKVLSLELFNRDYWKRPALEVAEEGLVKMKKAVKK